MASLCELHRFAGYVHGLARTIGLGVVISRLPRQVIKGTGKLPPNEARLRLRAIKEVCADFPTSYTFSARLIPAECPRITRSRRMGQLNTSIRASVITTKQTKHTKRSKSSVHVTGADAQTRSGAPTGDPRQSVPSAVQCIDPAQANKPGTIWAGTTPVSF